MSIDDRDHMRDRHPGAGFQAFERVKALQAQRIRNRFSDYSAGHGSRAGPKPAFPWNIFLGVVIAVALGPMLYQKLPEIQSRVAQARAPFPPTGQVRWFNPAADHADHGAAPLSIKGFNDAGRNFVVKLDAWETHAPVALIPIRAGETAVLKMPLGRYRMRYAPDASWLGDLKLRGETQAALESLDFYRTDTQIIGHKIDLNGHINGNIKIRHARFF